MMRNLGLALGSLSLAALPLASAAGPPGATARAVVSQSFGTYTQAFPAPAGDLISCAPEATAVSSAVFNFLEEVCDDKSASASARCAGKFTALVEECANPILDVRSVGSAPLIVVDADGLIRVCFDPAASTDCTDPLPGGVQVVATGTTRTQTRNTATAAQTEATTEITATSTSIFSFNGKNRKLRFGPTQVVHTSAEPQDGFNCAPAPGCGFASTGVLNP